MNYLMTTVLVVDDHEHVRRLIRANVEWLDGFEVVGEAADGATGVEIALRLAPEIVVIDYTMPVMDGVEAIRRIIEHRPDTRVIAFTSLDDRSTIHSLIDAGAYEHVSKPDWDTLTEALARAGEGGRAPLPYPS